MASSHRTCRSVLDGAILVRRDGNCGELSLGRRCARKWHRRVRVGTGQERGTRDGFVGAVDAHVEIRKALAVAQQRLAALEATPDGSAGRPVRHR